MRRSNRQVYTDIAMFSGEHRYPVELTMGQLSHNLMIEEYPHERTVLHARRRFPLAFSPPIRRRYLGIGRFVLGLYDDIEIHGGEELLAYIAAARVEAMKRG